MTLRRLRIDETGLMRRRVGGGGQRVAGVEDAGGDAKDAVVAEGDVVQLGSIASGEKEPARDVGIEFGEPHEGDAAEGADVELAADGDRTVLDHDAGGAAGEEGIEVGDEGEAENGSRGGVDGELGVIGGEELLIKVGRDRADDGEAGVRLGDSVTKDGERCGGAAFPVVPGEAEAGILDGQGKHGSEDALGDEAAEGPGGAGRLGVELVAVHDGGDGHAVVAPGLFVLMGFGWSALEADRELFGEEVGEFGDDAGEVGGGEGFDAELFGRGGGWRGGDVGRGEIEKGRGVGNGHEGVAGAGAGEAGLPGGEEIAAEALREHEGRQLAGGFSVGKSLKRGQELLELRDGDGAGWDGGCGWSLRQGRCRGRGCSEAACGEQKQEEPTAGVAGGSWGVHTIPPADTGKFRPGDDDRAIASSVPEGWGMGGRW